MYEPDGRSRIHLYILAAFAIVVGWSIFLTFRQLALANECSSVSQSTSGIYVNSLKFDPYSQYDYAVAKCVSDSTSK
jgi:hypothetical protein